jgi:hypothetical protein
MQKKREGGRLVEGPTGAALRAWSAPCRRHARGEGWLAATAAASLSYFRKRRTVASGQAEIGFGLRVSSFTCVVWSQLRLELWRPIGLGSLGPDGVTTNG